MVDEDVNVRDRKGRASGSAGELPEAEQEEMEVI